MVSLYWLVAANSGGSLEGGPFGRLVFHVSADQTPSWEENSVQCIRVVSYVDVVAELVHS